MVQMGFRRLRRKKTDTLEDVQLEPEGGLQVGMDRRKALPAARSVQPQEETVPGQHDTQRLEAVSKGMRREMQQTSSTWRAVLQQLPSTSGRKDLYKYHRGLLECREGRKPCGRTDPPPPPPPRTPAGTTTAQPWMLEGTAGHPAPQNHSVVHEPCLRQTACPG